MLAHRVFVYAPLVFTFLAGAAASSAAGAGLKILPGHRPNLPGNLAPEGQLPGTNQLRLAIGVPLRDAEGLDNFLEQVYDPTSTNYQHYLTPEEFMARFGPTEEDWERFAAELGRHSGHPRAALGFTWDTNRLNL